MGKLIIVPTPIGNLEDITLRALRILRESDLILAEDTRQTSKLLHHYQIDARLKSYHQHNEHKITGSIIEKLMGDFQIALVSDAGTPGISDPGFFLVRACIKDNIEVECLPGPSALIPALTASGIASDRFCFEGFLPHKKGRKTRLTALSEEKRSIIFYESPYRLLKTLGQLTEFFGEDRYACIARELTKIHEEYIRGNLVELQQIFKDRKIRGEFVIIVSGKDS